MALASAGFLLMTLVAVGESLRAISRFEVIFKELGIQLPHLTVLILAPMTHVLSAVVLVALIVMRHGRGMKEWATSLWVVTLLLYLALTHIGLFEPLINLMEHLGQQAGPEHQ